MPQWVIQVHDQCADIIMQKLLQLSGTGQSGVDLLMLSKVKQA